MDLGSQKPDPDIGLRLGFLTPFSARPDGESSTQPRPVPLAEDPTEMHDLSETHPEKLAEVIALWEDYVKRGNVILPDETSGY